LGALKDASALELVLPLLKDKNDDVVVMAIRALAAIGDTRGVQPVAALLRSEDPTLLVEALKALAMLPRDKSLRPPIIAFVGHDQPAIRAAALQALAHVDGEEFALVLSTLDPDPVFWVRAALASALAESGDEMSLGVLYSQLKDDDARVLPAVLEAIRKARGKDATDTLVRYLEHPDFAVRAAAAEGLAALKAAGQTQALASAYRVSRNDRDLDARFGQVAALAVQRDPQAYEVLREIAGSDPARVVRARAAAALASLGQQPPWPGFQAVERPHLDYREAMAPYDPQPGVQLYTPRALLHTRRGVIEIHLNVLEAPLNVGSFLDLARRGFFDGLNFHRVVPNFVVQGGDPRGDGNGGPGYTLRCEVGEKPYGRGVVGMALSGKDTGGSQFFIALSPQPHLDANYTVIGWVARGMEVADKIQQGDAIERVEVWDGR
jgi:cyclophilin family peptidyl-prolyl cis-trans isomerase